ncbi:hypothetical protein TEA_004994 [Camellia sinensis var. sinensis]|uniref:Uncharacterized protein n=1 Tax=Camellia sinensis var. sinensis TaxID=542762 RepID=A0A4S4EFX0_CAMSN|nr:hypothetical protein TEA_004994 [Camellia sinensis var. sinensis]
MMSTAAGDGLAGRQDLVWTRDGLILTARAIGKEEKDDGLVGKLSEKALLRQKLKELEKDLMSDEDDSIEKDVVMKDDQDQEMFSRTAIDEEHVLHFLARKMNLTTHPSLNSLKLQPLLNNHMCKDDNPHQKSTHVVGMRPIGTTAYVEQSIPFPQDGKQTLHGIDVMYVMSGWWGGGFGYGLWIGILVASGFSVVPVPSSVWKNELKLSETAQVRRKLHSIGSFASKYSLTVKDLLKYFPPMQSKFVSPPASVQHPHWIDCNDVATSLIGGVITYVKLRPLCAEQFLHPHNETSVWMNSMPGNPHLLSGRAEALLIAAYGKGMKISTNSSSLSEELMS